MSASLFARPLLIYDDKCYSCTKFARLASALSRGWIRTAGHYYSQEAKEAKATVFPQGYDPTRMFWLINRSGAFGARSGLPRVAKEIAVGWFRGGRDKNNDTFAPACAYDGTSMSCYTPTNVFRRLATMLSHGASFTFARD
ncbi:hypothetical protein [Nitrososphaera sp.]|uniref:hypothetical protein n=1 Tax=Nitrososphaera sp. TaxID=1971748 RepID=UPI00307E64ED